MIKLKICGLRRPEDVQFINEVRPDFAGFILSEGFKRTVNLELFGTLRKALSDEIKCVGVFVDDDGEYISNFAEMLDVIQLHGHESSELIKELKSSGKEIWKAVRTDEPHCILEADKMPCDKLLIDSSTNKRSGEKSKAVDLDTIKSLPLTKPCFIAGGITPDNGADIIREMHPYGIDVSSGVETDGFKDREKILRLVRNIRESNL